MSLALRLERENAARYLDVVEVILVAFDDRARVTLVNRKGHAVLGYADGELLGRDWFQTCVPAEQREQVHAVYRQIMRGELAAVEYFENEILRKDGGRRLIAWHNTTVRDDSGRIVGTLSSGQDITERRYAERQAANEQQVLEIVARGGALPEMLGRILNCYETLIPGTLGSILLLDASGRRLHTGAAPKLPPALTAAVDGIEIGPEVGSCGTAAFTGKSVIVSDIATDPHWRLYRGLFEPFGLRSCWSVPIRGAADRLLGTFAFYSPQPRTPGEAELRAIERGAHLAGIAIERAATESALTASDRRFRDLVGSMDGIFWEGDAAAFAITSVSPSAVRILGYPVEAWLHPTFWADHIHPEDRSAAVAFCQDHTSRLLDHEFEYRFITADGRIVWLREMVKVTAENNRPRWFRGLMVDITETKQAEAQRAALERKLQETQKLESLGVLAGGIAHDFNNLLTGILGNASLAELDFPAGSPNRGCLEDIKQSALRAADLCKQMLAYSGQGRLVVSRFTLGRIVQESSHLLRISVGKSVRLDLDVAAAESPVEGDAAQLRQILVNLVANASEAIGPGPGTVTVTTGVTEVDRAFLDRAWLSPAAPTGRCAFLEVADTGSGMTPETQARIFDPFFTTKFSGRGLGLAAVLGIVRTHGGAIRVTSAPGRGSLFRLVFPLVAGAPDPAPPPVRPVPAWRGSGHLLVVDDEETVRSTAAIALRRLGFTVDVAVDGLAGVERFSADAARYTAVLMDLTMPRLDGEQAFHRMRALRPDLRVILMSGFNQSDAVARFSGQGLSHFLQKPFQYSDLVAALHAVLEPAGEKLKVES